MVRSSVDVDRHAQDVDRQATRRGYDDSRVDTAVSYVNSADDIGPEVTHRMYNAMSTCLTTAWHSSCQWSTAQCARRWNDSAVVLLGRSGNCFTGRMRAALTHSARWPAGQRMMGFIQRTEHDMTRADDYGYLLALAKHEVPLHGASDMLVQ